MEISYSPDSNFLYEFISATPANPERRVVLQIEDDFLQDTVTDTINLNKTYSLFKHRLYRELSSPSKILKSTNRLKWFTLYSGSFSQISEHMYWPTVGNDIKISTINASKCDNAGNYWVKLKKYDNFPSLQKNKQIRTFVKDDRFLEAHKARYYILLNNSICFSISGAEKIAFPATKALTPASNRSLALLRFTPPSTSIIKFGFNLYFKSANSLIFL